MLKTFTNSVIMCVLLLISTNIFAQVQLEFGVNSYPGPPAGPTIAPLTGEFFKNTTGTTFVSYTPAITVNAAWSDQQYTGIAGMPAGTGTGSTFGTTLNNTAKTANGLSVWNTLGNLSSPTNSLLTSDPFGTSGTGIDVTANYGFSCFTTVEPQYAASTPTNGRYYYSTLTLTFSQPVANPVLHVIGLGGNENMLGFSTELELQTAGVILNKLSGTGVFNITGNKILNSASSITPTSGTSSSTTGAATGSVRVTGNNITVLVFKVYIRGDGGGGSWSNSTHWAGDRWLLGFSMSGPAISGNVFDDANGLSGTPVNTVDGIGTNVSGQLFANLVDGSSNVVLSTEVASDGTYLFQDLLPAGYPVTYSIRLNKTLGTKSSPASAPSLPAGWINTGENLGAGVGNDGVVNGILLSIIVAASSTVVANANFGIERLPDSDPKSKTYLSNTAGMLYAVPGLTGSDPEDGIYGTGNTYFINMLPAGATLYYNGIAVTVGQTITNFTPALLTIDPLDATITTFFTYSSIDAAGKPDPSPASVTINWASVVPITLLDFTADKTGNSSSLKWSTSQEISSSYIQVERSSNAVSFTPLSRIPAAGNSSTVTNYNFNDNMPLTGKNYYRLKFISMHGGIQYSQLRFVRFDKNGVIETYPNPVRSQLNITFPDKWISKPVKIEMYNQLGELVLTRLINAVQQTERLRLNKLANAAYVLKLKQEDNTTEYRKIQLVK